MPKISKVIDRKPKIYSVKDFKPKVYETFGETKTFYSGGKGQPMGLLLALTYPHRI